MLISKINKQKTKTKAHHEQRQEFELAQKPDYAITDVIFKYVTISLLTSWQAERLSFSSGVFCK